MKTKNVFSPTLGTKYVNPQLWGKIQQINMDLIKDRMIIKHGWSEERTVESLEDYFQYLYMTQVYEHSISPTRDVDELWHEHILHTEKYSGDCLKTFGKFLHHFPTPAKWAKIQCDSSPIAKNVECDDGTATCDAGTTNCQSQTADCSNRSTKQTVAGSVATYDNPVQTLRKESVPFISLKETFFTQN